MLARRLPSFRGPRHLCRHAVGMGEAQLERLLGSAFACGGAEFAENRRHVMLDGPYRNEQGGCYLLVGLAFREKLEDFLLACCQTSRMRPSRGTGAGGNRANTKVSHPPAYQASRRLGTKIRKPCQRLSQEGLVFGVQ